MKRNKVKFVLLFLLIITSILSLDETVKAKENKEQFYDKNVYLNDLSHINITYETTKKKIADIENLIKERRPKAIYVEQWLAVEPHNKKLLKNLRKLTKKYQTKLYLVIGKNTWIGTRGISNAISAYDLYGEYIDGLVLRVEPNRTNVWKDDAGIKAKILNLMLDAYAAIQTESKKRNKQFIAEFPFWYTDFQGPLKSFSQNACDYVDKIIFLIDDVEALDKLETIWNDVTCVYNIDITKHATRINEETLKEIYKKLSSKLTLYSNFNGYIVDDDSAVKENKPVGLTLP